VEAARELAGRTEPDALCVAVAHRARLLLDAGVAFVALRDEATGRLRVRAAEGQVARLAPGVELPDLAASGPFRTAEYLADERIERCSGADAVLASEGVSAMLAVPLGHGGRTPGALCVAERSARRFPADEVALLSSLAGVAGAVLAGTEHLERSRSRLAALQRRLERVEADLRTADLLARTQEAVSGLVLAGQGLRAAVEAAARLLGGPVRVRAADGAVLAEAGDGALAGDAVSAGDEEPVFRDGVWTAPLRIRRERLGTLVLRPAVVLGEHAGRPLRALARTVAFALLLELDTAAEGRLREEVAQALLGGPVPLPPRLAAYARRLGLDLDRPHVVVVARPGAADLAAAASWLSSYARLEQGLESVRDDHVVLVLPGRDARAAAEEVSHGLTKLLGAAVTAGADGPVTGAEGMHGAYDGALRALDTIGALGAAGAAASRQELGFLVTLLSGGRDTDGFVDAALGPVLGHDRLRPGALVRTLDAYFACGGSRARAARRLHVHPNTVARRLERIGELLGAGWQVPPRAVELQLALRLLRVRRALRERRPAPD
jgi:hypothetical protein